MTVSVECCVRHVNPNSEIGTNSLKVPTSQIDLGIREHPRLRLEHDLSGGRPGLQESVGFSGVSQRHR